MAEEEKKTKVKKPKKVKEKVFSTPFWKFFFGEYAKEKKLDIKNEGVFPLQCNNLVWDVDTFRKIAKTKGEDGKEQIIELLHLVDQIFTEENPENSLSDTIKKLETEEIKFARELAKKDAEQDEAGFVFDEQRLIWRFNFAQVTDFHLIFHSIIQRVNPDTNAIEREFEVSLHYFKDGVFHDSGRFRMEPKMTFTAKAFAEIVWEKAMLQTFFTKDWEIRKWFTFIVNVQQKPVEIFEFNSIGFVQFRDFKFYVTKNALFLIPQFPWQNLRVFRASKDGIFTVFNNGLKVDREDGTRQKFWEQYMKPYLNYYVNEQLSKDRDGDEKFLRTFWEDAYRKKNNDYRKKLEIEERQIESKLPKVAAQAEIAYFQNDFEIAKEDLEGAFYFSISDNAIDKAPEFHWMALDEAERNQYEDFGSGLTYYEEGGFMLSYLNLRDELSNMMEGNAATRMEGTLATAFIFAQLFFNEIYEKFQHTVYLYIWGDANLGKGSFVKVMKRIIGITDADTILQPTVNALEVEMELHSGIPVQIDEFVPQSIDEKRGKISDQLINLYYELRQRSVSTGVRSNRRRKVRSNILFTSNYLPPEKHIRSRILKMEYARHKRGDRSDADIAMDHTAQHQKVFLDALGMRGRVTQMNGLVEVHQWLLKAIAHQTETMKLNPEYHDFQVNDRQIDMVAALVTTHLLCVCEFNPYKMNDMIRFLDSYQDRAYWITKVVDKEVRRVKREAIDFLVESAKEYEEQSALDMFLQVVTYLINEGMIKSGIHFQIDSKGQLKTNFSQIWTVYKQNVRNEDVMVDQNTVKKEMAKYAVDGKIKNMTWTDEVRSKKVSAYGFMFENISNDHPIGRYFPIPYTGKSDDKAPF